MVKGFGYEKEFDSIEKLSKYLVKIERLHEANVDCLDNGNWLLSFDRYSA